MTTEVYEHDYGRLFIAYSDKKLSTGLLVLNPNTEFQKHKKPVQEQLTQVLGKTIIKLFDKNNIKKIILKEGENLKIKSNQFHIHSNPYNKISVTMWKFEGDITKIINNFRKTLRRL